MKNIFINIICLSVCIGNHIDLNDNSAFSIGPDIGTPALGGNLKPEIQPEWDQADWVENIKVKFPLRKRCHYIGGGNNLMQNI